MWNAGTAVFGPVDGMTCYLKECGQFIQKKKKMLDEFTPHMVPGTPNSEDLR